jgi:hypothetical protein
MYRTTRTSTIYLTIAAATVALILLTSTTLTASVYATRHHKHRSFEDMSTNFGGYQAYGNNPISDQGYGPQLAGQAYGNGNPVDNQAYGNGNPVDNQAYGNGNPVDNQAYGNGNPVDNQAYGNGNQVNAPPVTDQTNGNGNNPAGNQVNAPPVTDQTNGNGNNPAGNQVNAPPVTDQKQDQMQTHAPTIAYKSPSSNDMLMSFANITQPLCAAGICSQSYTNH